MAETFIKGTTRGADGRVSIIPANEPARDASTAAPGGPPAGRSFSDLAGQIKGLNADVDFLRGMVRRAGEVIAAARASVTEIRIELANIFGDETPQPRAAVPHKSAPTTTATMYHFKTTVKKNAGLGATCSQAIVGLLSKEGRPMPLSEIVLALAAQAQYQGVDGKVLYGRVGCALKRDKETFALTGRARSAAWSLRK